MENNPIYHIKNRKGEWKTFNTYYSLLSFIDHQGRYKFGNSHQDKRWSYQKRESSWFRFRRLIEDIPEEPFVSERLPVEWVVWDSQYNQVDIKQLEKDSYNKEDFKPNYHYRWVRILEKKDGYLGFRNGPVPHTGKSVYGFYNWHRSPHTTQEKRLNCVDKEYTRGKRCNLPSTWDDVARSDREIKQSWKKNKKKRQWM